MWTGGVRAIVLDDRKRMLLVRQHHDGKDIWMVPGGTIEEVGEQQYRIKGDGIKLIYQWDGLFGITVIRPDNVEEAEAVAFLKKFF